MSIFRVQLTIRRRGLCIKLMSLYHIEGTYLISEGHNRSKTDFISKKEVCWYMAFDLELLFLGLWLHVSYPLLAWTYMRDGDTHRCSPPHPSFSLALFLWMSLMNTLTRNSWQYYFLCYDICWLLKNSFSSGRPDVLRAPTKIPGAGIDHEGHLIPKGFLSKIATVRICLMIHRCDSQWPLS